MKWKIVAVLLTVMTLLSGCSITDFDTQNLMRPPRATGDKAGIQRVLEEYAGKNITLKYPQKGEYRSAVIFYHLAGQSGQQAIAFYCSNDVTVTETHMMVMDEIDGKWQKIDDYSNPSTEVDKVCFGDLNGDGINEIIVGWSNAYDSVSSQMTVFGYQNGGLHQYPLDYTYTEFAVKDFDQDNCDEIFLASLTSAPDSPAAARLIKLSGETQLLTCLGSTDLDPTVTKYAAVTAGNISEKQRGIVIDGYRQGNQLATEVVYWDAKRSVLRAPIYTPNLLETNYTQRKTSTISKDIDGDGIIEIPIVSPMMGYSAKNSALETACYITDWKKYNIQQDKMESVCAMVANYTDGYYFIIPEEWKTATTAKLETETRTLTFYEWEINESGVGAAGVAVLKIQVFSKKEWIEQKGTSNFIRLMEQDDKIYAAAIPESASPLSMGFSDIEKNFKLITLS